MKKIKKIKKYEKNIMKKGQINMGINKTKITSLHIGQDL